MRQIVAPIQKTEALGDAIKLAEVFPN